MDSIRARDERRSACRAAGLLLLATTMLIAACGGSADSGSGDPLSCSLNTSFSGRATAPGTIILQMSAASCASLDLDVVFTGISGVFTVGFDITYPTAILAFNGYTQGPLLKQGSPATPPYFNVTELSPGRIAVFATRFSPDGGVDSSGAGTLMTLRFRATALGEGPVVFDLASSPVQEQVLNASGGSVSASFVNGSNLASVF